MMNILKTEAARQKKGSVKFAIFVGGLGNSGENELIDFVTGKHTTPGLWQGSRTERRAVESSAEFFCSGSLAYFVKFPCLCNEVLIDGRILARMADEIKNLEGNVEVSSFFYLVDDPQLPRTQAHQLHLQLWSLIFGVPPEPEASKFLVASSTFDGPLIDLIPYWEEHISGPRPIILRSHEQAEVSVRETISLSSQMAVRLRTELLQSVPLRKTTVGRHYVEILERHIKSLESGQKLGWKVWKKPEDPDGTLRELKTELHHWKKCKLPQSCKSCPLIE